MAINETGYWALREAQCAGGRARRKPRAADSRCYAPYLNKINDKNSIQKKAISIMIEILLNHLFLNSIYK